MENQPTQIKFVSKSYTIILALNVVVNVCVLLIVLHIENAKYYDLLNYFLLTMIIWLAYGFISGLVLLGKTAKSTNIKALGSYIYMLIYFYFQV